MSAITFHKASGRTSACPSGVPWCAVGLAIHPSIRYSRGVRNYSDFLSVRPPQQPPSLWQPFLSHFQLPRTDNDVAFTLALSAQRMRLSLQYELSKC